MGNIRENSKMILEMVEEHFYLYQEINMKEILKMNFYSDVYKL